MAVDLHIHSTASDGTLTPQEVVREAHGRALTAIAITDHDTVAGVEPALEVAAELGIDVFPAVEVSTQHGRWEAHILGYLIDVRHAELTEVLQRIRTSRLERAEEMVRRLQALGVAISYEDVEATSGGDESVGRPHVAAALVACGVVSKPQDAFERYLRRGRPAYVERYRLSPQEAVGLIRRSGGLPVLAHPGLIGSEDVIRDLMQSGVGGIEAYHVDHTPGQTARYLDLADKLRLVVTGGSDSHGPKGPKPVEIGAANVPDSCAEALRHWGAEHGRWPP